MRQNNTATFAPDESCVESDELADETRPKYFRAGKLPYVIIDTKYIMDWKRLRARYGHVIYGNVTKCTNCSCS